ncbi:unnamed protein product [Effrenium voratum]|nr:unnamed protein product [Effrenium voratum]
MADRSDRRRPVYRGGSLPPPPPPRSGARQSGSTLEKVREFLAEAGFDAKPNPASTLRKPEVAPRRSQVDSPTASVRGQKPEASTALARSRSTSEVRQLPRRNPRDARVDESKSKKLPEPPAPPSLPSTASTSARNTSPHHASTQPVLPPPPPPKKHGRGAETPDPDRAKRQRLPEPPPAPLERLPPPPLPPKVDNWHEEQDHYDSWDYESWDDYQKVDREAHRYEPHAQYSRYSEEEEDTEPSNFLPPPPAPGGPADFAFPPPPEVPKGWGKGLSRNSRRNTSGSYDYESWDDYWEDDRQEAHYSEEEEDEEPSNLPPPPPAPIGPTDRTFPPPPHVPKGWGKAMSRNSWRKMGGNSPWFCNVCNKDLWNQEKYDTHVQDDHLPCPEDGCTFSGPEHVMAVHKLKHVKAADGASVTDSPEEVAAWKEMRRNNYPCKGNLQRKAELEEKRRMSGALADPPKVSMLEKLLRRTHGVEKGKGFFGKGFGKKGKDKGKGKFKGKDGKGKEKGKDKGKGKGKDWSKGKYGKKGKGKAKWSWTPDEEPEVHPTYSVPLPSVVANCVPLEAPFASCRSHTAPVQTGQTATPKWGPCRFFERGFCYHGANCQYEHVGTSAAQDLSSTAWWILPSTLANRAGRPGEGPAGGTFGSLRTARLRATHVAAYNFPEPRERRDGLLRRLLRPDMERYYSAILQCVRYIVSTDFLRLERPALAEPSQAQADVSRSKDMELDPELEAELQDPDMPKLDALLK